MHLYKILPIIITQTMTKQCEKNALFMVIENISGGLE